MKKFRHLGGFLIFVIVASIVTYVMMYSANKSLRNSHRAIVEQHNNSLHLTYSLIKVCQELGNDSSKNSDANKALAKRIEDAAVSLSARENDQKTLNLLELEFSKIQNEYEVLNLWCALLTVVFLIFSFFSLFKTNELEKQGEQAVADLKAITIEAQNKSDSIDQKVKDASTAISNKEEGIIKDFSGKIDKKTSDIKVLQETTTSTFAKLQDEVKDLNTTTEGIKTELINVGKKRDQWLEEIRNLLDNERKEIPELIKQTAGSEVERLVKEQSERISSLERGLNELREKINRSATAQVSQVTDEEIGDVIEETEMEDITEDEDNSTSTQPSNNPEV